jgi:hypothetical protein
MKVKFSCEGSVSSHGESEITFIDSTNYKSKTVMISKDQEKSQEIKVDQSGKWLSADCGSIKPTN